jgi:hypothetical protein
MVSSHSAVRVLFGIIVHTVCLDQEVAAKWRVSTVTEMIKCISDSHNEECVNDLVALFEQLLEPQKIKWQAEQYEALRKRLTTMITRALTFAQLLCTQRAYISVEFPEPTVVPGNIKNLDDFSRTNIDNDFNDLECEIDAPIWYNVKPALVKYGTGMGQSFETEKQILVKSFVFLKTE